MQKKVFYIVMMGIALSVSVELQAQVYYSGCTPTSSKQASAIGLSSSSTGNQSFASGNYAAATGNYSTALGSYVQATASNAFTFGSGVSTSGYLINSTAKSLLVGFDNKPVLFAQLYSSSSARVGIGTKTPAYTLDVNGDANFNSVYANQIYFTGTEMKISKIGNGTQRGVEEPGEESEQESGEDPGQGRYTTDIITLKESGNVGIGTPVPSAKLEVIGTTKTNSLDVLYNGKMRDLELTGKALPDPEGGGYLKPMQYLKLGELGNIYFDGLAYAITVNWFNGQYIQNGKAASKIFLRDEGAVNLSSSDPLNSAYSDFYVYPNCITLSTQKFTVNSTSYFNGNVGVKEENPQYPLHVTGNSYITGNVGIGSVPSATYKLGVNGKIGCKEIVVTNNGWADYVFEPDYALMGLGELEAFVRENRRLPDVPSAAHVEENGVELSAMNVLLLKKVEELTLYILEQNKRIEVLEQAAEVK